MSRLSTMFRRIRPPVFCVAVVICATPAPAQVPSPTKIASHDSEAFAASRPDVRAEVADGVVSTTRVVSRSADKRFEAGLYSTEAKVADIESYPVDEFMLIVGGTASMTSADGTVLEVKKGDALFMPKGWKGRWSTSGLREFYVAYSAPDSAQGATPTQAVHPAKIDTKDSHALASPDTQIFQMFKYRVLGKSADKNFRAGLSSMRKKRSMDASSNVDEVVFLVSGGETFVSPDGTTIAAKAGDVVFMPKGWKGKYRTSGYREVYAIYGPECMADNSC